MNKMCLLQLQRTLYRIIYLDVCFWMYSFISCPTFTTSTFYIGKRHYVKNMLIVYMVKYITLLALHCVSCYFLFLSWFCKVFIYTYLDFCYV